MIQTSRSFSIARIQAAQQLVPQEEHAELLSELPTRVKDRLKK